MKCAVTNKDIGKKRLEEAGQKEAAKRISLYLDYVLADKLGYSAKRIDDIHATINKYIDDVFEKRVSPASLRKALEKEYGAVIVLGKERVKVKPQGREMDFVNGVCSFMDRFNIILLYVLIVKYKLSCEKVNKIMACIQNSIECFNQGYVEESELEEILVSENNVKPKLVGGNRFAK